MFYFYPITLNSSKEKIGASPEKSDGFQSPCAPGGWVGKFNRWVAAASSTHIVSDFKIPDAYRQIDLEFWEDNFRDQILHPFYKLQKHHWERRSNFWMNNNKPFSTTTSS